MPERLSHPFELAEVLIFVRQYLKAYIFTSIFMTQVPALLIYSSLWTADLQSTVHVHVHALVAEQSKNSGRNIIFNVAWYDTLCCDAFIDRGCTIHFRHALEKHDNLL